MQISVKERRIERRETHAIETANDIGSIVTANIINNVLQNYWSRFNCLVK